MALTSTEFADALADLVTQHFDGALDDAAFKAALVALYEGENLTTEGLALDVSELISTVKGRLLFGPVSTLPSAATVDLGTAASHLVSITGVVAVTSFGASASTDNPVYLVTFAGVLTLTHGANLDLPGNANIVTAAGDMAWALYMGAGAWAVLSYQRAGVDPAAFVTLTGTQTLTNKTLTAAVLGGTTDVSGGQIKFPAAAVPSADANTLDDYEEGTWTPALRIGGVTTGIAYGFRVGDYQKVGNRVSISCCVSLSSKGSGVGDVVVTGLPFAKASTASLLITGAVLADGVSASAIPVIQIQPSASIIDIYNMATGSAITFKDTTISNTTTFEIAIEYTV